MQSFFTRHYGPPNLTLVVVGDVDTDNLWRLAQRYWGDWTAPDCAALPKGPPTRAQGGEADSARPQVSRHARTQACQRCAPLKKQCCAVAP